MISQEESILQLLQDDIKKVSKALAETISDIRAQGFSKYPIIIAHPEDIRIADKILDRFENETSFHFSASTLEILINKGVILKDRKEALEEKMNLKENSACVLLVHPETMKIIFSPLASDE